jgi:hypothetical protein
MKQIILSQQPDGSWSYTVMENGIPTGADVGYSCPEDAATDANQCPTALANLP